MLHLLGVNLPDQKVVRIALTYFYGIGKNNAERICHQLSIHRQAKLYELSEHQLNKLSQLLTGMTLESDLKREIRQNIARYRQIGCYRGKRHQAGLPVRGQRTQNNAKTAKRLNLRWLRDEVAVGGSGYHTMARGQYMPAASPSTSTAWGIFGRLFGRS
jgi:small subunit ribosomal protein S13